MQVNQRLGVGIQSRLGSAFHRGGLEELEELMQRGFLEVLMQPLRPL